jgi:hypothetical protein
MASATLNMVPYRARSRILTYLASCAGSVVGTFDVLTLVLVGATAPGAPAILTDYLAVLYTQYLGAGATAAAYTAAQQQAVAMFLSSPLVQLLYNLGGVIPLPTMYPGLNQPPTPNTVTLPANFTNQQQLATMTDTGQLISRIRMSAAGTPNIIGGNNGPPLLATLAAGGSLTQWDSNWVVAATPGQAELIVRAPTGALGTGGANIPSGCFLDIIYPASVTGE